MKMKSAQRGGRASRRAFTLPELMVASSVGLLITSAVISLLMLSALEDRLGLGCATVEEKAYVLQTTIAKNLRPMSANQGMSPDYSLPYTAPNGSVLGYNGIYVFVAMTNGTYANEHIFFNSTNGAVTCVNNSTSPATQSLWMSNSPTCNLTNLWFSTSLNPDGSVNGSLVNVAIEMNDNGFAHQNPTNNCASVYRSFSVQLRGD
jgi:prepilin-type N-terminal cleavage/methylation domain-containing protein